MPNNTSEPERRRFAARNAPDGHVHCTTVGGVWHCECGKARMSERALRAHHDDERIALSERERAAAKQHAKADAKMFAPPGAPESHARCMEIRGQFHCQCYRAFVSRMGLGIHHAALNAAAAAARSGREKDKLIAEKLAASAAELEIDAAGVLQPPVELAEVAS